VRLKERARQQQRVPKRKEEEDDKIVKVGGLKKWLKKLLNDE
jgi:hypothetical protein